MCQFTSLLTEHFDLKMVACEISPKAFCATGSTEYVFDGIDENDVEIEFIDDDKHRRRK